MISSATVRAISLGAALGFIVAVVPSCGATKVPVSCNRTSCNGCCDLDGQCFTGTANAACGSEGQTCAVCSSTKACIMNACRTGSSDGGTGGGSGGGTGGGTGVGGGSGGGTGGGSGVGGGSGGGTGGGSGGAGGGAVVCGAANCATGCCDPVTGSCHAGTGNDKCGNNGQLCKTCNLGASESCNATTRTCLNSNNCDATNCANGCCSGIICVTDETAAQCGLGGASCVSCQGTQMCKADAGTCVSGAGGGGGSTGVGGGSGTGGGTGTGGGGFFPVGGGSGGAGGGLPSPCSPACGSGECCDGLIVVGSCVATGAACPLTSILMPNATCNASGTCQ